MNKLRTSKHYLINALLAAVLLSSCSHDEQKLTNGKNIAMPDYYRKVTGFDSIQLVFGGRSKYNEAKRNYDVTWDSLYANFCYPNKWEFERFKKDTVFIHDTVYKKQYINVQTLNQY